MADPKLTFGEKLAIARLEIIGAKRAFAVGDNQPDIERRVQKIRDRAARREQNGK